MTDSESMWTTERLQTALLATELFSEGRASAKLIDGVEPSLEIEMHEYGDLPIYMSVFGEQIIAESLLWPALDVEDVAGFNDAILRTHKYFPLSTVSLDRLTDGKEYYQMFGALSATSRIHNVLLEIETLASNVIQATEAYADFLRYPQAAGME